MKNSIFLLSALMIGIFLFGCVTNQVILNGEDNVTVQPEKNVTVQPGALGFSLPSELPIAYVGKPYLYSFCDPQPPNGKKCGEGTVTTNPTGGKQVPYYFTYSLYKRGYGGKQNAYISNLRLWSGSTDEIWLMNFTPETSDEGEYELEVCIGYYPDVCKNTTLFILSDTVKVKGTGKVTSSLMWDPRASVIVRGRGGWFTNSTNRPDYTTLVSLSEIPSVSLSVSTPPKDSNPGSPYSLGSSGGASVGFEMVANSTGISQSVTGDAPCGTPRKDGSYEVLNVDSFQVLGETVIGLNITNDGTTDKVVDIFVTGRSAVSSDSKYYGSGETDVRVAIGETEMEIVPNPYDSDVEHLAPGKEITDSKAVRVVVAPGSHVLNIGGIQPNFDGGGLGMGGCPTHLGISSGVTITTVDADLSDGKMPTEKIWAWSSTSSSIDKIE